MSLLETTIASIQPANEPAAAEAATLLDTAFPGLPADALGAAADELVARVEVAVFGHGEVTAADAHVCLQEFLAQNASGGLNHKWNITRNFFLQRLGKEFCTLVAIQMDCRHNHM